jgi:hypothetical protein
MKRIILALFAGFGLVAVPASADEKAPATAATTATPIVVTESATPARRGILARLRDRRATTTMTPATVVTPSTTTPVPTTPPTTVPTPLPTVKPVSGTTTTTNGVVTAGYTSAPTRTGLFSRLRNRGTAGTMTTTTPAPLPMPMSAVVPASGTVTMEPMMTEATTTTRMGLFARLRARR